MKVEVDLSNPEALARQEPHLEHGGLFVPMPADPPVPLVPLEIHLTLPGGHTEVLSGRAVQVMPEVGLALAFDEPERARHVLEEAVQRCADAVRSEEPEDANTAGEEPDVPETAPGAAAPGLPRQEEESGTLHSRIRSMSQSDRRKLALQGDRAARMLLMKENDKNIHIFVIQNPKITLDEVLFIAGYRQTHPDVLKRIAENREWSQNPRIVSNIVCNPKTPTPAAVRLIDKLSPQELRRIAKNDAAPPAVVTVIKRKVVGP